MLNMLLSNHVSSLTWPDWTKIYWLTFHIACNEVKHLDNLKMKF